MAQSAPIALSASTSAGLLAGAPVPLSSALLGTPPPPPPGPSPSDDCDVTFYGPTRFTRTRHDRLFHDTIELPEGLSGPFVMVVSNGEPDDGDPHGPSLPQPSQPLPRVQEELLRLEAQQEAVVQVAPPVAEWLESRQLCVDPHRRCRGRDARRL
jgi:hypothetical protein